MSWVVWTGDVHGRIMLSIILKIFVFDQIFRTKALRMMILVSRTMFLWSRNLMVSFIWPTILTFQGHDICKKNTLGNTSFTNE